MLVTRPVDPVLPGNSPSLQRAPVPSIQDLSRVAARWAALPEHKLEIPPDSRIFIERDSLAAAHFDMMRTRTLHRMRERAGDGFL